MQNELFFHRYSVRINRGSAQDSKQVYAAQFTGPLPAVGDMVRIDNSEEGLGRVRSRTFVLDGAHMTQTAVPRRFRVVIDLDPVY